MRQTNLLCFRIKLLFLFFLQKTAHSPTPATLNIIAPISDYSDITYKILWNTPKKAFLY